MTVSRRLAIVLSALLLCAAGMLASAATASAEQLLDSTLAADRPADRSCSVRPLAGDGVAAERVRAPGAGFVAAKLAAGDGDWDLAIFDRSSGRLVAGAAGFGAREVAEGLVLAATDLVVQACRRSGDAGTARLNVSFTAIDTTQHADPPKLVSVETPTKAHERRLLGLGLDLTEHGDPGHLEVVAYRDADLRKLAAAGLKYEVRVDDLVAKAARDRLADRRFARSTRRSALPTGRDTYRRLVDYEEDLKRLVQENPGLVKPLSLPFKTYEGRTVQGVEITTNVNASDGKPVFLQMGVHHAREWPSGEHAMEWAFELVEKFKAGDARARRLIGATRTIVIPIVNPDGFNLSRETGESLGHGNGDNQFPLEEANLAAFAMEFHRKNCRLAPPREDEGGDCSQTFGNGLEQSGVDPNRNYGGFWGGPGANQTNPFDQSYPGPGPFSEPETQNIRALVSTRHVTTLITNHTFSNLLLRPPALAAAGETPDEPIYKALGDSMAEENGYASQFSYQLYDTTGGTEDWTYYTTGGLGFTFEIGPDHFHPPFADTVAEWDGTAEAADDADGDGTADRDGRGNAEAYWKALASTADASKHSVIEGTAPAGTVLRLKKGPFKTRTYPQEDGNPIEFDDTLETTMVVPESGRFEWHVNQSTRPVLRNDKGRAKTGEPSPPQDFSGGTESTPCADFDTEDPTCYEDRPFTIPEGAGIDNAFATVTVTWTSPLSDWDLKVYRDSDGDGSSAGEDVVGTSGNGATNATFGFEEVNIGPDPPKGKYVARVINYAAGEPYEGTVTFRGPNPPAGGPTVEAWTLSCERGGQTLSAQQIVIERGERKTPDLSRCAQTSSVGGPQPGPAPDERCVPNRGFSKATARGRGRKVRMAFARRVKRPVRVDVFQQSVGRRVIGERLIARYRKRTRSFTWNGKANRRARKVRNGWYFVRYRMKLPGGGKDVRRVTLQRKKGQFKRRKSFYRRATCGVLRSYKLTRPVFGGRTNRSVHASFRLSQAARVRVVVRRGKKVVRRFKARNRQPNRTYRLRQDAERLRRGTYKFRVIVTTPDGRKVRSTLRSRRL